MVNSCMTLAGAARSGAGISIITESYPKAKSERAKKVNVIITSI